MKLKKHPVYIVGAKRSAVAKYGGYLAALAITEITAQVIKKTIQSLGIIKSRIDKVILGNVLSAGLGQNPSRISSVKAGLSEKTPCLTINQVCASGLQSIILGAQDIEANNTNLVLAGGMESMSRCPYLLTDYRFGVKFGHQKIIDGMIFDGIWCSLENKHMGLLAEKLVLKFKISRLEQDKYAFASHKKAIKAIDEGRFKKEIVPIKYFKKKKISYFKQDEQPRRDTSFRKLQQLKPAFKLGGTITAGNASSINDAAAVVLLASEKAITKNNLKPLVVIKNYATVGVRAKYFGLGAYEAILKCLKKTGLSKDDIDLWEINEAFSCQILAVLKLLKVDKQKVNVNGGAIALGHPIGASGTRILTTLIYELKKRKLKYGMAALCVGGGQGVALLIENV